MTNVGYRPVEISWAPQTPSFHLLYSYQPCRADTLRNSPSGKTNEIGIKNTKDLLTINYSLKGIGLFCTKQKFVSKMFDWAQIIWICYLFEEYLCHFLWFILGSHQFRKQMANIKHKEKFMDCWNMIYFLNTLLKLMLTKILFKSHRKKRLTDDGIGKVIPHFWICLFLFFCRETHRQLHRSSFLSSLSGHTHSLSHCPADPEQVS